MKSSASPQQDAPGPLQGQAGHAVQSSRLVKSAEDAPVPDKSAEAAPLQWFAAKTRMHQELKIKSRLDALGVECFLPLKEQVRILREKKQKVMRPLVPRLIFLHCRREQLYPLINEYFVPLSYIPDLETKRPLVIPDRQMKDFMFFVDFARDSIRVINDKLRPGDRVRVVKGDLAGLEGELIRIKGHKRVVVRLQGLFSVAAGTYLPRHFLEPILPPTEQA
ncbi:MAG TPA: UpxY family transcription antiterminator [Candidatus Moranbacteria bacterium]|jgi:transcription antitermination factor NusG|nr:UpxY family transcription antiterminator [Candidatus Moranbacteria bacterium]